MRRHYARLADARDFEDPEVLAALRSILPERDPAAHVERKAWEMAMLALFLEDVGVLHDGTEALAIGAGDERIVFWLANRVGRVLRPGGHAFLAVDTFVRRDPLNAAPVDFAIRVATLGRRMRAATPRRRAALGEVLTPAELRRWIVEPSGLEPMQPFARRTECPLALRYKRSMFTSAGLPLRKRSR
jgi:hypothetical protein